MYEKDKRYYEISVLSLMIILRLLSVKSSKNIEIKKV